MSFQFKRFVIDDTACAMKVGTDGVLLGTWARIDGAHNILDVGTGSGMIAIILAQRFEHAHITGIDIDTDAVAQAKRNMEQAPWNDRLQALQSDFLLWTTKVDAIVCNPPFFTASLKCPDKSRSMARHDDTLPLPMLAAHAAELLNEGGVMAVILPVDAPFTVPGMSLRRRCIVLGTANKSPKRQMLEFVKGNVKQIEEERLILLTPDGKRTADHQALTCDFYL